MSDPLRTDQSPSHDAGLEAERTAKIEQLLLAGLDHYFSTEYEQAINVWTRALFLDRGHARARAYIERARAALAEQQRKSEELLHSGLAAFQRGETPEARRLLQTALTSGAPSDVALAALDRLDRLEHTSGVSAVPVPAESPAVSHPDATARVQTIPAVRWPAVLLLTIGAAAIAFAVRGQWRTWLAGEPSAPSAPVTSVKGVLPLPRRGETALSRARALVSRGHLREALSELEVVKTTDPERAD